MGMAEPNDLIEIVFGLPGQAVDMRAQQLGAIGVALERLFDLAAEATGQSYVTELYVHSATSGSLSVKFRMLLRFTGRRVPGFLTPLRPWLSTSADAVEVYQFLRPLVIYILAAAGVATLQGEPADSKHSVAAVEISAQAVKNPRVQAGIAAVLQSARDAGYSSFTLRVPDAPTAICAEGRVPLRGQIGENASHRWIFNNDPDMPLMPSLEVEATQEGIKVKRGEVETALSTGRVLASSDPQYVGDIVTIVLPQGSPAPSIGSRFKVVGMTYGTARDVVPMETVSDEARKSNATVFLNPGDSLMYTTK